MAKLKCKIQTDGGEYDNDFDTKFVERVKAAGHISSQDKGFRIDFEYKDEDGHHKVDEEIDASSWDDMDKIACIVLTYIYAEQGGFDYSTLESIQITGQGKVMYFDRKVLTKITEDMEKEKAMLAEEEMEKKELARLQAKYKKAC